MTQIAENAPLDTFLFTAKASDLDSGRFGEIFYSLRGELSRNFVIGEKSGDVRVGAALDYESRTQYQLEIVAEDGGGRSAAIPVQIVLIGVDEFAPNFSQDRYTFQVAYESPVNDTIGTVYATDADKGFDGQVRFSLEAETEYFRIHPSTGIISVQKSLDSLKTKYPIYEDAAEKDAKPLVQRILLTVIARSGGFDSFRQNSSVVELQLGDFPTGGNETFVFL